MKNRTDKTLLAVLAVTLPLYAFIVLTYFEIIPMVDHWEWPSWVNSLYTWLALGFLAVPVFCLQLLMCRRTGRWAAASLALFIIGAALFFACGYLTARGWDSLFWGVLMLLSIAPAAGCALGWIVYGLGRICRRGDTHV